MTVLEELDAAAQHIATARTLYAGTAIRPAKPLVGAAVDYNPPGEAVNWQTLEAAVGDDLDVYRQYVPTQKPSGYKTPVAGVPAIVTYRVPDRIVNGVAVGQDAAGFARGDYDAAFITAIAAWPAEVRRVSVLAEPEQKRKNVPPADYGNA